MQDFRDRVSVVTGAASGIGRALALELAREGSHLALSDIDEAGLQETARSAEKSGVQVSAHRLDVADRVAVFDHAERVRRDHGRVNLVVNNAGVGLAASISEMAIEDLEWLMGINYWGVVHGTQAFLPHLKAADEGHVVNVSSVFGLMAVPSQSAYNSAKFAVRGFTECLRQELELEGCAVSATCVHPGGIKTNIIRKARLKQTVMGDPDREDAIRQFDATARTSPEKAAEVILAGVRRNKRRVLIGADAHLLAWLVRLFPTGYQRLIAAGMKRSGRVI